MFLAVLFAENGVCRTAIERIPQHRRRKSKETFWWKQRMVCLRLTNSSKRKRVVEVIFFLNDQSLHLCCATDDTSQILACSPIFDQVHFSLPRQTSRRSFHCSAKAMLIWRKIHALRMFNGNWNFAHVCVYLRAMRHTRSFTWIFTCRNQKIVCVSTKNLNQFFFLIWDYWAFIFLPDWSFWRQHCVMLCVDWVLLLRDFIPKKGTFGGKKFLFQRFGPVLYCFCPFWSQLNLDVFTASFVFHGNGSFESHSDWTCMYNVQSSSRTASVALEHLLQSLVFLQPSVSLAKKGLKSSVCKFSLIASFKFWSSLPKPKNSLCFTLKWQMREKWLFKKCLQVNLVPAFCI